MATLFGLPGAHVARAHTVLSSAAFATALGLGWATGVWEDLCENAVSEWPTEWWPSVSATIGDHAGPRAPFHLLIALTAGPRFALLLAQWLAHRYPPQSAGRPAHGAGTADAELLVGLLRTFFCGGWIFCTSRDHHDLHDLCMIVYLLLNIPWMWLSTYNTTNAKARRTRLVAAGGFACSVPPLVLCFYRHAVARIPGAYTSYAFVEWSLVVWDIAFDSAAALELGHLQIRVVDNSSPAAETALERGDRVVLAPVPKPAVSADVDWTEVAGLPVPTPRAALLAFLSDVWLAACFWTVFTSLGVQLFYWSVWKLALSGSELALLANLAAYSLASRRYRAFAGSRAGLLTHRVTMVVAGMGCYAVPSVTARLLCVVVGTWAGWCAVLGNLLRLRGSEEAGAEAKSLVVTLIAKYLAHSTNPFWPVVDAQSGGWNVTGLVISTFALFECYLRPAGLFPAQPVQEAKAEMSTNRAQRVATILGFGSLLHLIQTFITDAGTIIAWSWSGYPIRGPTLHPFAGVTIAVAAAAVAADIDCAKPTRCVVAIVACALVHLTDGFLGYAAGLGLVAFLLASLPAYLRAVSTLSPSAIGHAMAWLCFLDVASVFTVAYAFVPFGWVVSLRLDTSLSPLKAAEGAHRRRPRHCHAVRRRRPPGHTPSSATSHPATRDAACPRGRTADAGRRRRPRRRGRRRVVRQDARRKVRHRTVQPGAPAVHGRHLDGTLWHRRVGARQPAPHGRASQGYAGRRARPARDGPAPFRLWQPRSYALHGRGTRLFRRPRAGSKQAHVGRGTALKVSHRQLDASPLAVAPRRARAGDPRYARRARRARRRDRLAQRPRRGPARPRAPGEGDCPPRRSHGRRADRVSRLPRHAPGRRRARAVRHPVQGRAADRCRGQGHLAVVRVYWVPRPVARRLREARARRRDRHRAPGGAVRAAGPRPARRVPVGGRRLLERRRGRHTRAVAAPERVPRAGPARARLPGLGRPALLQPARYAARIWLGAMRRGGRGYVAKARRDTVERCR